MGLNEKQVRAMLDTELSPFVRAVGFLYLRFSLNPRNIWDWIKGYVDDEVRQGPDAEARPPSSVSCCDVLRLSPPLPVQEEFEPSPFGGKVTMGAYVRDVFLDMYYFETILPRVPQHIVVRGSAGPPAMALAHPPRPCVIPDSVAVFAEANQRRADEAGPPLRAQGALGLRGGNTETMQTAAYSPMAGSLPGLSCRATPARAGGRARRTTRGRGVPSRSSRPCR